VALTARGRTGQVGRSWAAYKPGTQRTALAFLEAAVATQHFFSDAELPFWQESNFRYLSRRTVLPGGLVCVCVYVCVCVCVCV
jgi:hypothetical protein